MASVEQKALIQEARDYANGPYKNPELPVYVMVNALADELEKALKKENK